MFKEQLTGILTPYQSLLSGGRSSPIEALGNQNTGRRQRWRFEFMSTGQNLWQCVDIMTFYSSSQPRRKEATIGILSERQPRQKNNKFKTSPEFDIFGLKFASKRNEPCECFLTPEAWRCHC